MHQSTTPSLLQTIWPRWASRQFLTLSIVLTLFPVTFAYSLSSKLSLWDNWGDERGCDEGHWHTQTRWLPWGLPEVVGAVQVYCSRRRLLGRGLEFYVCTINKSAHIWWSSYIYIYIYKNHLINYLLNDSRVYMYIYTVSHRQTVPFYYNSSVC